MLLCWLLRVLVLVFTCFTDLCEAAGAVGWEEGLAAVIFMIILSPPAPRFSFTSSSSPSCASGTGERLANSLLGGCVCVCVCVRVCTCGCKGVGTGLE